MDTVLEITQPMLQILLPAEAAQAPEVAQVPVDQADPEVAQVQVPVDLALEAALAEDPEEVPAVDQVVVQFILQEKLELLQKAILAYPDVMLELHHTAAAIGMLQYIIVLTIVLLMVWTLMMQPEV